LIVNISQLAYNNKGAPFWRGFLLRVLCGVPGQGDHEVTPNTSPPGLRGEGRVNMKYYRQWKEHPEKLKKIGEPVGWFKVTEEVVCKALYQNIKEWNGENSTYDQIKEKLLLGQILQSSCAMYIGVG